MIQPARSVRSAGGAALCTCLVASTLVAAPVLASPPPTAAPAVELTASTTPFDVTVPELIEQIDRFATLVEPLTPDTKPSASQDIAAAAVPLLSAASGTPIANGVGQIAATILRGVVGLLAPFVRIPALTPLVGGAILAITFVGGIAVAAIYGVIAQIEGVIGAVIGTIAAALGGIVGLPATLSGAATAGTLAGPAPVLRTAVTFVDPEQTDPDPVGTADSARTNERNDTEQDRTEVQTFDEPEAPGVGDPLETITDPETTVLTAPEGAEPAFDPDELLSDEPEAEVDQHELTSDPSSQHDEEETGADPAPASPSGDSDPANDGDDAPASDET